MGFSPATRAHQPTVSELEPTGRHDAGPSADPLTSNPALQALHPRCKVHPSPANPPAQQAREPFYWYAVKDLIMRSPATPGMNHHLRPAS